ncbi:MAG: GTP-binding protein [Xanthobacteraceae bacterium]|nr:GTP-binding protein [Xanthobacteraceae bacterium]
MAARPTLVPITVLTGFLGSGKTTTLNHLLRQDGLRGTIAIVNEFGEVGIDHLLIETTEERFALLDNGCVCCTVRGDLVDTLKAIAARRDAGDLPDFDRVLLETTGLADPAPVLHTLMVDPAIGARYRIDGVVVTVDAVNGAATLATYPEAVKQVGVADRLLITKTDLVDETRLRTLRARLTAVNPTADLIAIRDGKVAAAAVLDIGLFDPAARSADVVAWFERAAAASAGAHHHDHCAGDACDHPAHDHAAHGPDDHGVHSFSLLIDGPVEWEPFARWLDYVASLRGEDLLRFKGIVNVAGKSEPVVVHGVQHVFHPPKDLAGWPTPEHHTRLVFIVRDIEPSLIERTLGKFASIDANRIRRPPREGAVHHDHLTTA